MRAGVAHDERVAVGRRLGDRLRADDAARTRTILDHDLLSQHRRQLVGDERAMTSGASPGVLGATSLIGFVGHACAKAPSGKVANSTAAKIDFTRGISDSCLWLRRVPGRAPGVT